MTNMRKFRDEDFCAARKRREKWFLFNWVVLVPVRRGQQLNLMNFNGYLFVDGAKWTSDSRELCASAWERGNLQFFHLSLSSLLSSSVIVLIFLLGRGVKLPSHERSNLTTLKTFLRCFFIVVSIGAKSEHREWKWNKRKTDTIEREQQSTRERDTPSIPFTLFTVL